jgi:phospholipase C
MDTKTPQGTVHPAWLEFMRRTRPRAASRRQFISSAVAGAGGLALWSLVPGGAAGPLATAVASGSADLAWWPSNNKIKHVVILCQENRSFDHYFGAFASMFGSGSDTALGFQPSALGPPSVCR